MASNLQAEEKGLLRFSVCSVMAKNKPYIQEENIARKKMTLRRMSHISNGFKIDIYKILDPSLSI